MHRDDLLKLLRLRPFKPFRFTVTTNQEFDVTHPDQAVPGDRLIGVGIPASRTQFEFDSVVWVNLQQIVFIQPIRA